MATIRKTITLSEKQDAWIKTQIAHGRFANDSEYIRDLLRRDQEAADKAAQLRDAIAQGLTSGHSDRDLDTIWAEAEGNARLRNA